jgi:hypothetical protein
MEKFFIFSIASCRKGGLGGRGALNLGNKLHEMDYDKGVNNHCGSKINTEYSETSIHRFRRGSEKETMDLGKQ